GRTRTSCRDVSSVLKSVLQVFPSSATHAAASSNPEPHPPPAFGARVVSVRPLNPLACLFPADPVDLPSAPHEMSDSEKRRLALSCSDHIPSARA
ncbi:hypothetical protein FB107DRAFT_183923, partial [Schizophyllum commune]